MPIRAEDLQNGEYGPALLDMLYGEQPESTLQTLTGNDTISPVIAAAPNVSLGVFGLMRVTSAGNITGCILGAGIFDHQFLSVRNEGAFTVNFNATPATSRVANGNASAIAAGTQRCFSWSATLSLWFPEL